MDAICRDCINVIKPQKRCNKCGSPRVVQHPELFGLNIAHVDCDAFYAAVEKINNPKLVNKPVIVGGGQRGVVSTCCYIARINGVKSAMPMFKAKKLCPEAVVIKPNMKLYAEVSRQIRKIMEEMTPDVEPISIDEAFLDLKGTELVHQMPPALTLAKFAKKVEEEVGVSVSIGVAPNKFLAKIASDINKPKGYAVIGQKEAKKFLSEKPVSIIWGVGKQTKNVLKNDGITLIKHLQDADKKSLQKKYGAIGTRLAELANGVDTRKVKRDSKAKSVSAETTFEIDLNKFEDMSPVLRKLAERVSGRLKKNHLAGQTITLKLKTDRFELRTRNITLPNPTQLATKIYEAGNSMLKKETNGTKFRLIGIGAANIQSDDDADQDDLVSDTNKKIKALEKAVDTVNQKFGDKIETGITFSARKKQSKVKKTK